MSLQDVPLGKLNASILATAQAMVDTKVASMDLASLDSHELKEHLEGLVGAYIATAFAPGWVEATMIEKNGILGVLYADLARRLDLPSLMDNQALAVRQAVWQTYLTLMIGRVQGLLQARKEA